MKKLRPYQERAKDDIYKGWDIYDILFLVLATGGGKSVIASDVIYDYISRGKRVLFIAHRDNLITQFWQHLKERKIYSGIIMADYPQRHDLPTQVCSIQTIARRKNLPPADLIVIDEAHHVTDSNSYNKILIQYPNAKVLLVSATPYRLSGEGFKELVKGKQTGLIINSTIGSLIADGWLVPFRYFIASFIDTSDLHLSKGDYIGDEVYNKIKYVPLVPSYLKYAPNKQGIIYASNVQHSKDICDEYNNAGIPAAHIDSDTPDDDYYLDGVLTLGRINILNNYRAGIIKVVSNVGILTEGTDFPNCDFVQWACLTKSLSKFLQGCGRATRPLTGLVDPYLLSQDRRDAIASSSKSHAQILDNTGMFKEHGFPDEARDWERYFNGTKGKKKDEEKDKDLEILVYIFIDEQGVKRKTSNIQEIEGCELVEVTKEIKQKIFNIKSLTEFDRLYDTFLTINKITKPGYMAANNYIKHCEKNSFLMVPEIWDYMKKRLVDEPVERENKITQQRERNPNNFPEGTFERIIDKIRASSVSVNYLIGKREEYQLKNKSQMDKYTEMKTQLYR